MGAAAETAVLERVKGLIRRGLISSLQTSFDMYLRLCALIHRKSNAVMKRIAVTRNARGFLCLPALGIGFAGSITINFRAFSPSHILMVLYIRVYFHYKLYLTYIYLELHLRLYRTVNDVG